MWFLCRQVWKECKDNYSGNENKLAKNESGFIVSNYPAWIHKLVELLRKLFNTSLCMCRYNLNNIIIRIFKCNTMQIYVPAYRETLGGRKLHNSI